MPQLVIVESPAKAKTISNFLGKDYVVEASFGHVRDLPAGKKEVPEEFRSEKWAEFGVNVEDKYQPVYVVSSDKKKQISHLRKLMKNADGLLLATDEDREGESISWHLLEVLKPSKNLPVQRIVFHEITREAIEEALKNPRDIDYDLVHAQESRRILDRLFGYKLSPVLWRKVMPGLSAGRVQSVAVRLIVEREEERRAFKKSVYWDLEALVGAPTGSFKATLVSLNGKRLASGKDFDSTTGELTGKNVELINEARSKDLVETLLGGLPWTVQSIQEKPATMRPYPPFTTSTLQQEANRKLRFTAKRTMSAAQKLYEGIDLGGGERVGLITYMRTDSVTLSDKALRDAQKVIRDIYGDDYAKGPRQYKTKTRNAQEAHEAIRPTEISRRPADVAKYLSKDEQAIYELIWKRTVASQMPEARLLRTSVEILARGTKGNEGVFTASGKRILFPGFLRAYVEGSDDPAAEIGDQEVVLPKLAEGQKVLARDVAGKEDVFLEDLENKRHETSPPARYTEASLVKKLEEEGIGRPSTYASIISTIQDRGYIFENKSGQLIPTFTAMAVNDLLRKHFTEYVDYKFTARMEEELDSIANGDMDWVDHLKTFFEGSNGTPGLRDQVESKQKDIDFPRIALGQDENGETVMVRVGKYGPFITRGENGGSTAANIPRGTAPADLSLEQALKLLNAKEEGPRHVGDDPETGLPVYATTGRFGAYVQLGDTPEKKGKGAEKPKRASLEKGMEIDTITMEEALRLLSLPRELGTHPETGEVIIANNGRYGPYVQHQRDFRSLKKDDSPYTITLDRALELLAEPKAGRGSSRGAKKTVLKELGETKDGLKLQILDGRYGAYVTDGKRNATIPKDSGVESVTLEQGVELLAAKAQTKGKTKGRAKKKS